MYSFNLQQKQTYCTVKQYNMQTHSKHINPALPEFLNPLDLSHVNVAC